MKSEVLLIRLDPKEKKRLAELAWLKKMSMAEYVRMLIQRAYNKKENQRRGAEANPSIE